MQIKKVIAKIFLVVVLSFFLSAAFCAEQKVLKLATTTSTQNSGLLEYLLPFFAKESGYETHVIAVGTGKALRMGCDGDADVVLVHAPKAEKAFVEKGCGEKRHAVMANDFVIVGPKDDPARLAAASSAADNLKLIQQGQSLFVSRGDDSGTHKKELGLWRNAGIKPAGKWYREAGQGMGKVLQMAGEMDAYTLTDRATWLAYKAKSPLQIAYEGDAVLQNPYSIIAVNAGKYPDINYTGAAVLIDWITGRDAQRLIADFKIENTQLFKPTAKKSGKNQQAVAKSQKQ